MSKAQQAVLAAGLVILGMGLACSLFHYPLAMPQATSKYGDGYILISEDGTEEDLEWVLKRCKEGKEYIEKVADDPRVLKTFNGYYDETFVRLRLAWFAFHHIEAAIEGENYGYPDYLGRGLIRKHMQPADWQLPSYARWIYAWGWLCMMLLPVSVVVGGIVWFISLNGRCKCK